MLQWPFSPPAPCSQPQVLLQCMQIREQCPLLGGSPRWVLVNFSPIRPPSLKPLCRAQLRNLPATPMLRPCLCVWFPPSFLSHQLICKSNLLIRVATCPLSSFNLRITSAPLSLSTTKALWSDCLGVRGGFQRPSGKGWHTVAQGPNPL